MATRPAEGSDSLDVAERERLETLYWSRIDRDRERYTADGAAQDPQVFQLASDVQVDQLSEISRMERMLAALPASR